MLAASQEIVQDNQGSMETWAHIQAQKTIDRVTLFLEGVPVVFEREDEETF
jgi:hypothetical protein